MPLLLSLLLSASLLAADLIRPKVVVVVTFDQGQEGEFSRWVDRERLTESIPFPSSFPIVRANKDHTIVGVVTGMGSPVAAASILQLGFDPRFDLSKSYWLVNGIAGVDPNDASLGSAAWARYVIDGDLLWELDSREIPAAWPYGRLAVFAGKPNEIPKNPIDRIVYPLNAALADWAYQLTRNVKLPDTKEMAAYRARYAGFPNATSPPRVFVGDSLGSSNWWHGKLLNQWANDWVKLWTKEKGNYAMTNREDHGIVVALERLAGAKKADFQRLLVLRTASNFSMQAPGQQAAESLRAPMVGTGPALEACYLAAAPVVHELLRGGGPTGRTTTR